MGMTVSVVGFKPPGPKWKKMKAAYDACEADGIETPKDVDKFFNYEAPDNSGVRIEKKKLGKAVTDFSAEMQEGFEIDVTKLPKDVTIIRFVHGQ